MVSVRDGVGAARSERVKATAAAPGDPLDLLDVDAGLDPAQVQVRDTVARLVRERFEPELASWFEQGVLPRDVARELGAVGLLGMHLSGYGCAGMDAISYGVACRELEAGDTGLRSLVSVQGSLVMFPIHAFGSEEQRTTWLPRLASGDAIGCFGLTEADSGSDPGAMRTRARRAGSGDGADWILDGSKLWITNGSIADVALVWARCDDGAVRGFLVPRGTPGFSAHDVPRKLSLRASVTSELVLADVRLPADAALPGVASMRGPLSCLSEARYGIVWGVTGAARRCLEVALSYTAAREQFERPLAAFQLTQQRLVEMAVRLQHGMLVARRLGELKDAGGVSAAQISLGKLANVRDALWVAREARALLGAAGITLDHPVMRHMVNLESVYTYEGTNEIHTLIVGEALTGIRAFA
jgi:glutaryl-CoA dehydrogenase